MSAWIMVIFLANGGVTHVPGWQDFDSCVKATQGLTIAWNILYPVEDRPKQAQCWPAVQGAK